ncbi:cellulase family glycosylhydrolase [Robertmurraya massiliosenegalensis]|uniref:cellulase family glycosylhydrolase n=1 Tax=Robertmurraya TaxID=2837507 RepID=UPI0039A784AD
MKKEGYKKKSATIKKWRALIVLVVLFLCLALYFIKKYEFVETPTGLGINIHFTGKQADIDRIVDADFDIVRTDLFWSSIEKDKGEYDFETNGYDELTNELINKGIRPYYVLDYSNLLYEEDGTLIKTVEGLQAFNHYVDEATERYRNKSIIWEVWNEPNIQSWDPKEYYVLLKQTYMTIKENDRSGYVVAPALAGLSEESLDWLEQLFKEGALDFIDALSVHPYRSWSPETVSYEYDMLRKLLEKYSSKQIPIISGEWGYSTGNGWYGLNLTEEQQAAYLIRMILMNMLEDIPLSVIYGWENDGTDENNGEHNFGIRHYDTSYAKLAYEAINAFSYLTSNYQLLERVETDNSNDYVLKFINDEEQELYIMWSVDSIHEIKFPIESTEGQVFSMLGKRLNTHDKDNRMVEIGNEPLYFFLNNSK